MGLGPNGMGNFELPGGAERMSWEDAQAQGAGGRGAFTSGNDSPFRDYQNGLAARLSRQVNGEDSLSRLQLQDSTNQNIAQQRAMAAGAAPNNVAMAQRLAQQQTGSINQGFGHQAAQLGIQERNAAANALAGLSGQARGQDLQNNQFNAGMQLQNRGQNDQYSLGQGQLATANATGMQRGTMGYEGNQTTRYGIDKQYPEQSGSDQLWGMLGAVAPYAAMAFMADGGVATEPTEAIVGEAGPEAILPLGDLIGANAKRPEAGSLASLNAPEDDAWKQDYLRTLASQPPKSKDAATNAVSQGLGTFMMLKGMKDKKGGANPAEQQALAGQANKPSLVGIDSQMQPTIRPPTIMGNGGIVTKPTHTIIGEAGPEAVVPLDKLPALVERLQQSVGRPQAVAGDYQPAPARQHADILQRSLHGPVGESRSDVSVVSHERDPIRERPWQAMAQAEAAQRAADEAQAQANYLRRFSTQNYGVNR
jgi:hypothetical protein